MSASFRKFIFLVASIILSNYTMEFLGWIYLNYLVNPGDTFGGELIVLLPLGIAGVFFYYYLLSKILKNRISSDVTPQKQNKIIIGAVLFTVVIVIQFFGSKIQEDREHALAEERIANFEKESESFLRDHCTVVNKDEPILVYRCDDGTIR